MNTLLEIKNVTKYFGSGDNVSKALNGVSFSMEQGEFTAVMGASGSGKSTLLNVIATIDRPSSGSVLLEGRDIAEMREQDLAAFRRDRLGFIFQEYNLLDTLTVGENIVLPLNLQKRPVRETQRRLQKAAASLGITEQLSRFPRQLSGGQRQRAACARALITEPALILADEPTGALDSANSKSLMQTFTVMNQRLGSTILMVTHDAVVGSYASRILFLKDGKIWNELYRGDRTRQAMYHEILNTMAVLGGEANVR
ncbi:MAG: ABC transporter ATP-binding protein [Faecousia sp.]